VLVSVKPFFAKKQVLKVVMISKDSMVAGKGKQEEIRFLFIMPTSFL
jgi:hypothetical protein